MNIKHLGVFDGDVKLLVGAVIGSDVLQLMTHANFL